MSRSGTSDSRRYPRLGATSPRGGWLADCHVHLHDQFPVADFLNGAAANLTRAALHVRAGPEAAGCLFLTETFRREGFQRLGCGGTGQWAIQSTKEAASLLATRPASIPIALISGRQVVTRERLEVLVLGSLEEFPDREPIVRTLDRAKKAGALTVLPWGLGKWTLSRGKVVRRLLANAAEWNLFVGDNGNRPGWLPTPPLLRRAADAGLPILPGSDPLPLGFHAGRAGRCGVFVESLPDLDRPASQIIAALRRSAQRPELFWQSEPFTRFIVSQALIQLPRWARTGFRA